MPHESSNTQNDLQPKAFSSISQNYQENFHPIQMLKNEKLHISLSNPPSQHKNKVIICPKCDRKGNYAIACPNESDSHMWWKLTLHGRMLNQRAKKLIKLKKLI